MKYFSKLFVFTIFTILILSTAIQGKTIHKIMDNGMEIVVKENQNQNSAALYCFVKTGSLHEEEFLGAGISHYLEHIVSGGTTSKHTEEEYKQMAEKIGAVVNAYTFYNVTAYHIMTDAQFIGEALQILSENVQYCSFDQNEIDREKEVILKEIVYRSSPPQSQSRQKSHELFYPSTNLKYPIIGYTELFKELKREDLMSYYNRRYVPNNMVFTAVGNFNADTMYAKIETAFKDFQRENIEPAYLPREIPMDGSIEFIEEFDLQFPTVRINKILTPENMKDEIAIDAASDILFGKRVSPVTYKLKEELELINYLGGWVRDYNTYSQGSFMIMFEAKDPSKVREIINIMDEEIEKFLQNGGAAQEHLDNLISRYKAYRTLKEMSIDDEADEIGRNLVTYGYKDRLDYMINNLNEINPEDINNAIRKYFTPEDRAVFISMPLNTRHLIEKNEKKEIVKKEVEEIDINDEIKLFYKYDNSKPIINISMVFPLSTDYETLETAGCFSVMNDVLFSGSEKYKPLELSTWLEDHLVSLDVSASPDGTIISFKCIYDDLEKMKDIIKDIVNNPVFDEKEISLIKENYINRIKRGMSDPEKVHQAFRNSILYKGEKNGLQPEEEIKILENLDRDKIIELYEDYFKMNSVKIAVTGDVSKEEAKKISKDFYEFFPKGKIEGEKTILEIPELNDEFVNKYPFEQVNVNLNFSAPKIGDDDFIVMQTISEILNGSRGRIMSAVRGNESNLAYFGYAYYAKTKDYAFFRLISQTSADKKDELKKVLIQEIEKLKKGEITQEEIEKHINDNYMSYKMMLNAADNYKLARYITRYEASGLGYDFNETSYKEKLAVTPEQIKETANKYFKNMAIIISEPDETVKKMVD